MFSRVTIGYSLLEGLQLCTYFNWNAIKVRDKFYRIELNNRLILLVHLAKTKKSYLRRIFRFDQLF